MTRKYSKTNNGCVDGVFGLVLFIVLIMVAGAILTGPAVLVDLGPVKIVNVTPNPRITPVIDWDRAETWMEETEQRLENTATEIEAMEDISELWQWLARPRNQGR